MVRQQFKAGDDIRDAGLTTPEDIVRYDDIQYGASDVWQVLDLYRPRAAEGQSLPVIISVHGGGWVYGNKERYQYYCMSLAQHGFAVVNFTYRLAPEFKFPAPLEDLNLVVQWVMDHKERYLLDVGRVYAVGDSAGAHQLSIYSAACNDAAYAERIGIHPVEGFLPTAVALNCGAYIIDPENDTDSLTMRLMSDYLPNGGSAEELDIINVIHHVNDQFPPAFIMTGTGDFLQNQAAPFVQQLMKCSVPHEFHFYGDRDHELGHVFHCNIKLDVARTCNTEECNFFRKYL